MSLFFNFWQRRAARWLARRIPPAPRLTLGYRNLFILPSRLGYQYLLLLGALFVLGTNYQNNLVLALAYLLLSLFITTLIYCHQNMVGITLSSLPTPAHYVGDTVRFAIRLQSPTPRYALQLQPHRPGHSRAWPLRKERRQQNRLVLNEELPVLDQASTLGLLLSPWRRGILQAGRLELSSHYPLGLFKCWTLVDLQQEALIYPKPTACHLQPLVADPGYDAAGNGNGESSEISHQANQSRSHNVEELSGLRPHKPGEAMSLIAWKQFAQGRGLLSKEFATEERPACWLSLSRAPGQTLEEQISALCYQVLELGKQGQLYGLRLAEVRVPPGHGNAHQEQALHCLATFRTTPYTG